jgi:hypothetical protein
LAQTGENQLVHLAGSRKTIGYFLAGIAGANYENTRPQLLSPGFK